MALLLHARNDGFRDDERCVEVDVYDLAEVLHRHFLHRYTLDDSGVVDEDIDGAELLFDVGNHFLHLILLCAVADVSFCVDALGLIVGKSLVHVFLTAAVEGNLSTSLSVSLCNGKTDTVSGTSDEGYLSLE